MVLLVVHHHKDLKGTMAVGNPAVALLLAPSMGGLLQVLLILAHHKKIHLSLMAHGRKKQAKLVLRGIVNQAASKKITRALNLEVLVNQVVDRNMDSLDQVGQEALDRPALARNLLAGINNLGQLARKIQDRNQLVVEVVDHRQVHLIIVEKEITQL